MSWRETDLLVPKIAWLVGESAPDRYDPLAETSDLGKTYLLLALAARRTKVLEQRY